MIAGLMYSLIKILGATLSDSDPRWLAFGLQMPSISSTPPQPTGLSVHLDENDIPIAQNDATPLATRYRYRGRILGLENDYRLLASSKEPMASLPGMLPGQTLELISQAVNGNLQGVASDPILFTMPPVTKAKVAPTEPKAPAPTEPPATARTTADNGHTNGHRRRS